MKIIKFLKFYLIPTTLLLKSSEYITYANLSDFMFFKFIITFYYLIGW